jgi:aarF domain-containing kinase
MANPARTTTQATWATKTFPAFSKFSNSSRASLRVLGLGGLGGLGFTTLAFAAPIAASTTTSSSSGDGSTLESRLLAASEEEKKDITELSSFQKLRVWLMEHLWEPIATSVRFVTLLVIFAPVILTAPVVLLRESKAGQTWWYAFLVQSLERAGPTFIKVS